MRTGKPIIDHQGNTQRSIASRARDAWNIFFPNSNGQAVGEADQYRDIAFDPGIPMSVVLDLLETRSLDYATSKNLSWGPDAGRGGITITQLRNFADNCEIFQIILDRVLNKISSMNFDFQLERYPDGKSPSEVKKETETNPNIKKAREMYKRPDGMRAFRSWLRRLIEEYIVTDFIVLFKQPAVIGSKKFLRLIDCNTIVKMIDRRGETPFPPAIAYQQVIKGIITKEFTTEQMFVYHGRERVHSAYGFSAVAQMIQMIRTALNRSNHQQNFYAEGNIPDMFMRVTKEWSDEQIAKYQKYFDLLMVDPAKRRKIRFIPEGMDPFVPQKEVLKDEFDEWIARFFCFRLGVAPTGFIRNINRATGEQSRTDSDEEGMVSLMSTVKEIIDTINDDLGMTDIEFVWIQTRTQDSQTQSEIDASDVKHGIRSIDEVRDERGLPPIGMRNLIIVGNGYRILEPGVDSGTPTDEQKQLQIAADAKQAAITAAQPKPAQPNNFPK